MDWIDNDNFSDCSIPLLSRKGRIEIGLTKPRSTTWILWSIVFGGIFSIFLYFIGFQIFDSTFENWYVYIGRSYNIPVGIQGKDKLIMFTIMSITGMIFSPIGEELFFRGIVHSSFAKSFGDLRASIIDSLAFAITHISHFGLVFINNEWKFLTFPTSIWVFSMFLVRMLFYWCRKKSGSLLGAIICHSAFNFGMIYCIFYLLN